MAYKTGVFEASINYVRGPCPAGMAVGNRFSFRISSPGPGLQPLPGGGHAPCPALLAAADACLYRIVVGFAGPLSCLAGRQSTLGPGDGSERRPFHGATATAPDPCPSGAMVTFSISRVPGTTETSRAAHTDGAAGTVQTRKFQRFPRKPKGARRIAKAVRDKRTE